MAKYKKADLGAAKAQRDAAESGQRKYLKLEGGGNRFKATRVRIAPPEINMPTWFVAVPMHFQVGVPGKQRTVGCPGKMFKSECPICEAAHFLRENGKEEEAKSLYATTNYLMNAFIVNDEDVIEDETCYIWSVRQGVFGSIWDEFEPNDAGDLTVDLTDIEVKRKGKGKLDTEYKVTCEKESSPFPGDLELLDNLHDLTKVTEYLTPEQAVALLTGRNVPAGPMLTSGGNPWEQEALPEGVVEGEAEEVTPEPEPEEEGPSEEETAAKAAAAAAEALAAASKGTSKGKGKQSEAPAEEKNDDESEAEKDASPALADLQAFVNARSKGA